MFATAIGAALLTAFSLLVIRTTSVTAETAESLLFYKDNRNIEQRLNELKCRREELRRELKESKDNIEGLKRKYTAQKDKVSRLQASLKKSVSKMTRIDSISIVKPVNKIYKKYNKKQTNNLLIFKFSHNFFYEFIRIKLEKV
jgi:peptidoglycan hydrolase CwlO-like protein